MKKLQKKRYYFIVFTIHFLQDKIYIDHSLGDIVIQFRGKFSRKKCIDVVLGLYSEINPTKKFKGKTLSTDNKVVEILNWKNLSKKEAKEWLPKKERIKVASWKKEIILQRLSRIYSVVFF